MGYSSRILAESWESNTLYWAELADETNVQPSQLNVRIPEWTEKLVERIFASHLEDWPAVLRSLRAVGDDVRNKTRQQALAQAAPPQLANADRGTTTYIRGAGSQPAAASQAASVLPAN